MPARNQLLACSLACLFLSCLLPAQAAAEPRWPEHLDVDLIYRNSAPAVSEDRWNLRLGAGIEREPTYQGSDRSDEELDPFLVASYRFDWGNLFFSGAGLGYSRMMTDNLGIMLQLEAEDTREVDDDARLAGLGNQDEELELEIVGRYFIGDWTLGASVAVASGDKGTVWFVGGSRSWRLFDDRAFVSISGDLSGSTKSNQQTDFGITAAQSLASGFPEYSPGGGLKSAGIRLNLDYQLSDRWYLYSNVDFERLLGDVADSPIVFDENNVEAGLGFYFRF